MKCIDSNSGHTMILAISATCATMLTMSVCGADTETSSGADMVIPVSQVLSCVGDADSLYRLGVSLMPTNASRQQLSECRQPIEHFFGYGFVRGIGNVMSSPFELVRCLLAERESAFATGVDKAASRCFNGVVEVLSFGYFGGGIYDMETLPDWIWNARWRPQAVPERTRKEDGQTAIDSVSVAIQLIGKAANKGHAKAQHTYGKLYLEGLVDGTVNYDKAVKWLERAVNNGDESAKPDLVRARGF